MIATAPAEASCLYIQGRIVTYGVLREQAHRVAQSLRECGMRRGDSAAIWLPNVPEWLVAAWACACLGVKVVPLNMRYGIGEVGNFLARTSCHVLFFAPQFRGQRYDEILHGVAPEHISSLRTMITIGAQEKTEPPVGVARVAFEDLLLGTPCKVGEGLSDDVCITFASSGTTSSPKLIQHDQQSVYRHAHDVKTCFRIDQESRVLLAVPFGGAFGFTIAISALSAHATLVVQEQFVPEETARLLAEQKVTHFFGTDDMLDKILSAIEPQVRFPELQVYGYANFTPALTATLPAKAAAFAVPLRGCYGLSESMALFATQPEQCSPTRRVMPGGLPVCPDAMVRVRSLETGELLPAGETGEIEIFSPNLTLGYLGDAAATIGAFQQDGFLRTGDLGYLMSDGGFTFLSRIGDILRIGGYLVNPLEIEETVLGLCDAAACQVIAVDNNNGVRPVAFVVGRPGYAHQELAIVEGCKRRLATYKVPIRVFELAEFPLTEGPNGMKVKRNVLKDMALKLLAAHSFLVQ
ncbi:MAG: AMP-binding protein [Proteobacteria bacterium]|nr:AMP-binding protein [Pseudomonadota bacterium]